MATKQYCGFKIQQRKSPHSPSLFIFASNARDINEWATINRLKDRSGGTQRRLSESRVRAIHKFFSENEINTTPTGIIIAFKPGRTNFSPFDIGKVSCENDFIQWGTLSFDFDPEVPVQERPAFVVDGQHRLIGMSQFMGEDLPVLVSAILDADDTEQAFQFIVINNKVSRVPTDLIRSLLVDFNENDLDARLKTARISMYQQAMLVATVDEDSESPFYHMVKWDIRGDNVNLAIKPQAIESGFSYIRHVFPRLDEDEDSLIDFFFGIWLGIKNVYEELWNNTDNRLFENAGFKTFTSYITDQIAVLVRSGINVVNVVNIYDPKSVTNFAETIAKQVPVDFWKSTWIGKSLDTSSGRELIDDQINKIRQNIIDDLPWWTNLTIVSF